MMYGVLFLVNDKVKVNGKNVVELYKVLKEILDVVGKVGCVEWNFEKFLILFDGDVLCFCLK